MGTCQTNCQPDDGDDADSESAGTNSGPSGPEAGKVVNHKASNKDREINLLIKDNERLRKRLEALESGGADKSSSPFEFDMCRTKTAAEARKRIERQKARISNDMKDLAELESELAAHTTVEDEILLSMSLDLGATQSNKKKLDEIHENQRITLNKVLSLNMSGRATAEEHEPASPSMPSEPPPDSHQVIEWNAEASFRAHKPCGGMFAMADGASCGAFSKDGDIVITGGCNKLVETRSLDGTKQVTMSGHGGWVLAVSASPRDSSIVASTSRDESLKVWDRQSGKELRSFRPHGKRNATTIRFSYDGQRVVTGSTDKTLKIWDTSTWTEIQTLKGHTHWITKGASFLQDDTAILSGSRDKTVRLWDTRTGEQSHLIKEAHLADITEVAGGGDPNHVVSVSRDMQIKLWDIRTLECLTAVKGHDADIWGVTHIPSCNLYGTCGKDKVVKIWDASLKFVTQLEQNKKDVAGIFASPTGNCVGSASQDGFVRIFQGK